MATLREARRLAKLVWPDGHVIVRVGARGAVAGPRHDPEDHMQIDGGRACQTMAPTRRAALAGLCAALEVMIEEGR